jgi:hypothetical protein
MISKKTAIMAALAIITGAFLAFGPMQGDQAYGGGAAVKLEGAWARTNTLSLNGIPLSTIRGTVTFSPSDPSGRTAVMRIQGLSVDLHAQGNCPNTYYLSDMVGEAVMTGPKTAEGTAVGYGMRPPDPSKGEVRDQIECIWVGTGFAKYTDPDSAIGEDYISVYLAEQDTDGDMLPDTGIPVLCVPLCMEQTRIRIVPPCTRPTPWPFDPCTYPAE